MNESKPTEQSKHLNHYHELTDRYEFVDFGNGGFIANVEAIPLLQALHDVGLRTRTHHIGNNDDNRFFSILIDPTVEVYIRKVEEMDRSEYNGMTEVLIQWSNPNSDKDVYEIGSNLLPAFDDPRWVMGERIVDPNECKHDDRNFEDFGVLYCPDCNQMITKEVK